MIGARYGLVLRLMRGSGFTGAVMPKGDRWVGLKFSILSRLKNRRWERWALRFPFQFSLGNCWVFAVFGRFSGLFSGFLAGFLVPWSVSFVPCVSFLWIFCADTPNMFPCGDIELSMHRFF